MERHPIKTDVASGRGTDDPAAAPDKAKRSVDLLTPLIAVLARQVATQYPTSEQGSATLAHACILFALTAAACVLTYMMRG